MSASVPLLQAPALQFLGPVIIVLMQQIIVLAMWPLR